MSNRYMSAARGPQYGSGAGSDPMETGFRRRPARSPSPERGFQPGGPIMRGEWSDQIHGLQQQITALNSTVADHAHAIGKMRSELENTIPTIIQRIGVLETSVNQRYSLVYPVIPSLALIACILIYASPSALSSSTLYSPDKL